MVQLRKQGGGSRRPVSRRPSSPKHAAACCGPIDDLLDPALFKALGDPTRALLLSCIVKCGRACSVGEVAECCSVDLSVVSRHLQQLARSGVLEAKRSGRVVTYAVRATELVAKFRALADEIERACVPGAPKRGCCG